MEEKVNPQIFKTVTVTHPLTGQTEMFSQSEVMLPLNKVNKKMEYKEYNGLRERTF